MGRRMLIRFLSFFRGCVEFFSLRGFFSRFSCVFFSIAILQPLFIISSLLAATPPSPLHGPNAPLVDPPHRWR